MSAWLDLAELRVALGCMRAFVGGDEAEGAYAIEAALDAGVTVLDTARTYGASERVVGEIVRARADRDRIRIVTKGGMTRDGNVWKPEGRARSLRADCEASLEALGVPIDAYLVHAPDPSMSFAVTMRALAKLAEEKLVRRVGVCNVSLRELDEALDVAPIAIVQVALGAGTDAALRGGVVGRCASRGITVMAHSPLGGPKRAAKLARDTVLAAIAKKHGVSAQDVVVAALVDLDPCILPVVGATRRITAETLARAARLALELDDADRIALDARFGFRDMLRPRPPKERSGAEIVLLMGLQGSGKSTFAAEYVARGYERLNRDARGGTLSGLHAELDARLSSGVKRIVLDNTYTTRASRWQALASARRHGAIVRGVWIDVTLEDAQVNVATRMLRAHGRLLEPREMERAKDPSALSPSVLTRTARAIERPEEEDGFDSLDVRTFTRNPVKRAARRARFIALEALSPDGSGGDALGVPRDEERVVFAWRPNATDTWLRETGESLGKHGLDFMVCTHVGGPPRCWCRPPLPGLLLAYARAHDVDLAASIVVGTSAAHAKMAEAVSATFSKK